jgi:hypothetical protein
VFVSPDDGVKNAVFFIDGKRVQMEANSPFDLAGTNVGDPNRQALPFDTAGLADGVHTISAVLELTDGSTETVATTLEVTHPG